MAVATGTSWKSLPQSSRGRLEVMQNGLFFVAADDDLEEVFAGVLGQVLAGKVLDDEQVGLQVLAQRHSFSFMASSAIMSRTRSKIDLRRTRKPCLIASYPMA